MAAIPLALPILLLQVNATYKGHASGLHTSSEDGIQRLLGKVTLTADFEGTSQRGNITGEDQQSNPRWWKRNGGNPTCLKLIYGGFFTPILPTQTNLNPRSEIGNIKGINYKGSWAGSFPEWQFRWTDQPAGIVGVVGGSGGGNSFVASFGAKKVETTDE